MLKVVKVQKTDFEIINAIIHTILDDGEERPTIKHLEKLLCDDRTYILAAFWNDVVIGYALAYRFPSLYASNYLAYLYDIEVLAAYRKKGAGRLLIETLLPILKSDHVSELWLGTATDNFAGQTLFTKTGGVKSGETFNDFIYELF
jgi:ribosomal protein S18 acetylase RimI-like enzyme